MAKARVKPIHLIIQFSIRSKAACDKWCCVVPIEATLVGRKNSYDSKDTFNPNKVTCKRCLKHPKYKEAMDRVKYPLFFLKENQ